MQLRKRKKYCETDQEAVIIEQEKTNNNIDKKTVLKMNEEVNRNEVSRNIDKGKGDPKRMITRTARFSMNEEAASRKKIKNMQ